MIMPNAAIRTAFVAATLLLAACEAPRPSSTAAAPAPSDVATGWIVPSMTKDLQFSVMELSIRPVGKSTGGRDFGIGRYTLDATYHQFPDHVGGYIRIARVPAGRYHIVNFKLLYTPARFEHWSPANFSIPFEVKANEVAYIGQFLATGTKLKYSLGNIETAYFLMSNEEKRDMPIAVAEHPELGGVTVRAAMTASSTSPLMRTTRLPDSK